MKPEKIALVTGANRGIGFEVSRQLGALGFTVLLGCRNPAHGEKAQEILHAEAITAKWVELDVSSSSSIEAVAARIEREYSYLDVLVNNAAIHYDNWQRVTQADMTIVEEAISVNTLGPWLLSMALLPMLRKSRAPRIVNVSSASGSITSMSGGTPAYSTSKAALNAITRMMALELEPEGFLVNAVCPGWTQTDMGGHGGRPVADGARGIVWAATLDQAGPSGGFFQDGEPLPW